MSWMKEEIHVFIVFFQKAIDFKFEISHLCLLCLFFCASGLFRGCCLLQVVMVGLIICGASWTPQ